MTKPYCYLGEPANIGRFGWLEKGAKIDLTVEEERGIQADERFEEWNDAKHKGILKPKPKKTAAEVKAEADAKKVPATA